MKYRITIEGGKSARLKTAGKYCDRDIVITATGEGGVPYDGNYVVTPRIDEQIMATKHKVMSDDVTIKAIPFFDVSNTSGGSTVYIGNEV